MREVLKRFTLEVGAAALLGLMASSVCPNASLAAGPVGVDDAMLWLDAAQLTGLNNGATVTTWTDMSGNNSHLSASGSAATYQANAINGQPVVRFNPDGNASFNFTRISTIRTVFWVVKKSDASYSFLLGDSETYHFHVGFENGLTIWSSVHAAAQNGATKLMGTLTNGTVATLPIGSYALLSLVANNNLQANQLTQDRGATSARSWRGDIAEVLIYDRPLSSEEESRVGAYLAAKYGLVTAYPDLGTLTWNSNKIFWDSNGSTTGFGTAAGTWAEPTTGNATQGWSTNTVGEMTPENYTTTLDNSLFFGYNSSGFTGTVTVDGTVAASNITFASSSGAVTLSGGTITLAATTSIRVENASNTISSALAGASVRLSKTGGGTLSLSGPNTCTGETLVNGGTLLVNHANALPIGTTLTAEGTGTLDLNGYSFTVANLGGTTIGGTITDNAAGTGTNTLAVTAFTTWAMYARLVDGPTRVLALTIQNGNAGPGFRNNANTFSGGLTLKNGSNGGTRMVVDVPPVNTGTAGAIVSSPFGRGPITLGEAAADRAQLLIGGGAGAGTILNDIIFNTSIGTDQKGGIRPDGDLTLAGTLTANLAPVNAATYLGGRKIYLTGRLTGPGSNGGLLLINHYGNPGIAATLNNQTAQPNDYAGSTVIESLTTLILGANEQIPHGAGKGDVYVQGKLNLNGFSETLNGLYGAGTVDGNGSTILTVGGNNASSCFAGVITNSIGALTLVKTGAGGLSLKSLAMSYSGETLISNGTLTIAATPPVPGMARWFDASLSDCLATNAQGKVTQWLDLSTNGAHAVNATGVRLPIYAGNTLNGRGTMQFSSQYGGDSGDYLSFSRDASIRTVFSVFKGESFLLTDSDLFHFHRPNDTSATEPLWAGGYISPNIAAGTTYVNRAQVNGVTFPMPVNLNNGFNLVTVQTTNSVQANSFNKDRTSHSGNQSHAELLLYDRVLTESERVQTEEYLSQKWLGGGTLQNPLPVNRVFTILSGGTLNLNGYSQEVATVRGEGTVSNGTLTVANAFDLTNGVMSVLAVKGNLTLKPGAALNIDQTATATDQVSVTGTLALQGANTVRLNTLNGALPPFQITLFTFNALTGPEHLTSWSVELPPALQAFEARLAVDASRIYLTVFPAGTLIQIF